MQSIFYLTIRIAVTKTVFLSFFFFSLNIIPSNIKAKVKNILYVKMR